MELTKKQVKELEMLSKCREAIEKAAGQPEFDRIEKEYGSERAGFILANTVIEMKDNEQITDENRKWADEEVTRHQTRVIISALGNFYELCFEIQNGMLVKEKESEIIPDKSLTTDDMMDYGYCWTGMFPLSKETASELYKEEVPLFCLYSDGTESMIQDLTEIKKHDGIFGVEKSDWSSFVAQKEYVRDVIVKRLRSDTRELVVNLSAGTVNNYINHIKMLRNEHEKYMHMMHGQNFRQGGKR